MSKIDQVVLDLHFHQSQSGTRCPMLPEEIAAHEAAGRIIDLDTGEVLQDIDADTRVEPTIESSHTPTTSQDIDALIIELRAALARLERRPYGDSAFVCGFKSGAMSAYSDILRLLGQDVVDPIIASARCAECGGPFTEKQWNERHSDDAGDDVHEACCAECSNG